MEGIHAAGHDTPAGGLPHAVDRPGSRLAAGRETRPAERDTLRFISVRLAHMADDLNDADLQQCMAVAAHRASPADLAPRQPGHARKFLEKCVKRIEDVSLLQR